jgi:hypothetical protein
VKLREEKGKTQLETLSNILSYQYISDKSKNTAPGEEKKKRKEMLGNLSRK